MSRSSMQSCTRDQRTWHTIYTSWSHHYSNIQQIRVYNAPVFSFHVVQETRDCNKPFTCHGLFIVLKQERTGAISHHLHVMVSYKFYSIIRDWGILPIVYMSCSFQSHTIDHGQYVSIYMSWSFQLVQMQETKNNNTLLHVMVSSFAHMQVRPLTVKSDNHMPVAIFPDLGQTQIICGGVKVVLMDP